jgi:hypothetical protein
MLYTLTLKQEQVLIVFLEKLFKKEIWTQELPSKWVNKDNDIMEYLVF